MSEIIPLPPIPGREEAIESLTPTEGEALVPPPSPNERREGGGGETSRELTWGTPSVSPERPRSSKGGGVTEGEPQVVRLPKKPRQRAERSEAQREERSLKGVSYGTHYKGASSKRLPNAPLTNPYKCHKPSQQNTLYPYTSHMLGADP